MRAVIQLEGVSPSKKQTIIQLLQTEIYTSPAKFYISETTAKKHIETN